MKSFIAGILLAVVAAIIGFGLAIAVHVVSKIAAAAPASSNPLTVIAAYAHQTPPMGGTKEKNTGLNVFYDNQHPGAWLDFYTNGYAMPSGYADEHGAYTATFIGSERYPAFGDLPHTVAYYVVDVYENGTLVGSRTVQCPPPCPN